MPRSAAKYRYQCHKGTAKHRGIPFLLTYEQWLEIWLESGKWHQRGWRRGQYVMARPGDKGAYEVGNVVIRLAEDNRAERNQNYPNAGHHRNPWPFFKDPEAAREKMRQGLIVVTTRRHRDARGLFVREG